VEAFASDRPLSEVAERHRTLLAINNAVISSLTRDELFHAIAGALRRVVPFDRTAIFLHDPARDVLSLFILESSLPSTYFTVGLEMRPDESHVGWVFQHRRPLLRRDLGLERQYPAEDLAYADGVRSYIIVPLLARGMTVGTLAVASTVPNQYSESDAEFLQEVAAQVALAIQNMKAYEELAALNARVAEAAERSRTLLEINNALITNLTRDALFQAVTRSLRRVLVFDRSAIFLHDPEKNVLRLFALESSLPSSAFEVGLEVACQGTHMGWVFENQRPLLRRNVEVERQYRSEEANIVDGVRSLLTVPLVSRGKSIGTLGVSSRKEGQYTEADAAFLQEVVNQVALAIENMRAYEEIGTLKARLERENVYLQEEIRTEHNFVEMVGNSPALLAVLRKVEQVAPTESTVLITGETGVGKELIARAIHARSPRKDRPLVKVNCSAISGGLVESELFGHVKGAFTGAIERRTGRFELADRGTIFLDEVGELPLETQVKLLRVLQEQEFEPVGSSRTLRVNVRVIAATNRNLEEAVTAGRVRADLFYRLNVFPLHVPPLRERRADVPLLATFFLLNYAKTLGKDIRTIAPATMERLLAYHWPGNIRELQNIIERAVILCHDPELELSPDLLPLAVPPAAEPAPTPTPRVSTLEQVQREHLLKVLRDTGWVIEGPKGAARLLGLHPNTLRSRIIKLGLRRPSREPS
jgi:formate hydrogenlyase transcriptional activator